MNELLLPTGAMSSIEGDNVRLFSAKNRVRQGALKKKNVHEIKNINLYLGSSNIQHFVVIAKTSYGKLS